MTRRFSINDLHNAAASRKPGYVEAVMRAAIAVTDTHVVLSKEDFLRLRSDYAIGRGVGSSLKSLLGYLGFTAKPSCKCNARAAEMDRRGIDWCEENIDTIVGWLRDEAAKRGLPFVNAGAKLLVKRAIHNARKAAQKDKLN